MIRTLALCVASVLAVGCASSYDPFRDQPTRVAYEVGEKVAEAQPQFQAVWNWYVASIDPRAPFAEIEVCLTIAPHGKVVDAYIDSSTIRNKAFVEGVLDVYRRMQFLPRAVPEFTLCDEPLRFQIQGVKPDPDSMSRRPPVLWEPPDEDEEEAELPDEVAPQPAQEPPPQALDLPGG